MDKITVMHYLCPETEGTGVTHHLKPVPAGKVAGEVMREQECIWCRRSEEELRILIAANGGQLHPDISGSR